MKNPIKFVLFPNCPICGRRPKLLEVGSSIGLPSQYKCSCGLHCCVGDWFPTKKAAQDDWVERVKTRRGEYDEVLPPDEEKLKAIIFAIRTHFPRICGEERTNEILSTICSMRSELNDYRTLGPVQKLMVTFIRETPDVLMTPAEAIGIIRNSNAQLAAKMGELAGEMEACETKIGYDQLSYCQKEYNACLLAIAALQEYEARHDVADMSLARPLDEWSEDIGSVLWWNFPIESEPYCGTPLDTGFPPYVTHWTRFICPDKVKGE